MGQQALNLILLMRVNVHADRSVGEAFDITMRDSNVLQ